MYNDPLCKPWTSRTWAPEGFATRDDLSAHEARKSPVGLEEARTEKVGNGDVDTNGHGNGVGNGYGNGVANGHANGLVNGDGAARA